MKHNHFEFDHISSILVSEGSSDQYCPDDLDGEAEVLKLGEPDYLEDDLDGEAEVLRLGKSDCLENDLDGKAEVLKLGESEYLQNGYQSEYNQTIINHFSDTGRDFFGKCVVKKHKKKKHKKSYETMDIEQNGLPDTDGYKKINPLHNKADKRKTALLSEDTEMDMRAVERHILEQVTIRRIHDKMYYFDGRIYKPLNKEKFLLLLRSHLPEKVEKSITSIYKMEEVYKYLAVNPDIEMENTEKMEAFVRHGIVFSNCIYNVEYDEVYDFSLEYPFLFHVNAKYIPKGKERKTPNFDNFIERVSNGRKEIKELILQIIGYVAMHSMEAKCFFLLGTAPNSGKSLFGEFIARLFDEEFVGTVPLTELRRRFALGGLWKQAVNVSMDLPTRALTEQEVSQIKMITGERRVNTEEKCEPVGTTFLHCKCIYASNGRISLKVYDRAFWDRVVFVPFLHSVPKAEQDKNLLEKLLAEQDGIVSKAAHAARKLVSNNFIFNMPKEAKDILDEWSLENRDSITRFLENECVFNCEYSVFSSDLYEGYKEFCSLNGIRPETITLFGKRIGELPGIYKFKQRKEKSGNPVWKYEGIGIKSIL